MSDESSVDSEKYQALRRGLRSRRRDDHAMDLFRQAEANLANPRQVDRILLELGKCYNPLTNGPIVDLATRRQIVELLQAGESENARALLDDRLMRYAKIDRKGPESSG